MSYIYACKTNGKCRQLMFESYGFKWSENFPTEGHKRVYPLSPNDYSRYDCCTQCQLPLNGFVARGLNARLGNKEPSLDDLLSSLNSIDLSIGDL